MTKKIESILIVGGGSSGWMTAAAICKQLPEMKVTLIESPNVPIIGVGESTIGHINQYMHLIGLKDEMWMPHCNATYKTSIKFIDFRENPGKEPHTFHYPFGQFDLTDKPRGPMDWFLIKAHNPDLDCHNFAEFFHDSVLMTDRNKMTFNHDHEIRGFRHDRDTAYHMDATAFGIYLRDNICVPSGMTHILDNILEPVLNETGEIDHIPTEQSGNLTADLYVDCTGFRSLLLEQAMGVKFESFHDTLLNDRAIATVIPYIDIEKEMENYTSCTAIECGWVWNIPLYHRLGTGYVYSSKFATPKQAEEQFRRHLASNRMVCPDESRAEQAEIRHITIKHGVHEKSWHKNVIGVGLANGFIEPLESTGLMLTHETIIKLVSALKMRNGNVTRYDVDLLNFAMRDQIYKFKDFISQHYALSMRSDTPYWQAVTENIRYCPSLTDYAPTLRSTNLDLANRLHRSRNIDQSIGGIIYIAAGMGYNPMDTAHAAFKDEEYYEIPGYREVVWNDWCRHRDEALAVIDQMPSHYEFLRQHIHKS